MNPEQTEAKWAGRNTGTSKTAGRMQLTISTLALTRATYLEMQLPQTSLLPFKTDTKS